VNSINNNLRVDKALAKTITAQFMINYIIGARVIDANQGMFFLSI